MLWLGSGIVRKLVVLLLTAWLSAPAVAFALPPESAMLAERSLGSEQAKVTIVEYSSLTCPHCAEFHNDTLPQIEANYVDKGLVRYVARDFPLEPRALAAAMVARCLPPDRYFGFVALLFRDQQSWARSADPMQELKLRAQLAGLSPADFDACIADKALLEGIQTRAKEASKKDGIDSTPIFFVDGTEISGAQPYTAFAKAIDEALAQKGH